MFFLAANGCGNLIRERGGQNGESCEEQDQEQEIKIDPPSPGYGVTSMELYFLRHGEADWPNWKKPDDERPLTEFGKREMRDVAKFLDRLKMRPDLIVTSPLPRASQTAEIAAEYLKGKLRTDESLGKGFGMEELRTVLKRHRARRLMLVGHEPDFTEVVGRLTGASLKLSKAGVALVDVDPAAMKGRLLWLFPPKFARRAK
jgi:phosphohistidine phosphatase